LRSFMSTLPEPAPLLGANGQKDFYKAVITRKKFGLNEINAHRSTTIVNMGKIAVRLNRNLNYDPVKQRFINDDEANRLVNQPMRGPWTLSGGIE
jgi:myo-inositol 2-dehydrogenase/D-chiro-inositol 1-dehydrogenase